MLVGVPVGDADVMWWSNEIKTKLALTGCRRCGGAVRQIISEHTTKKSSRWDQDRRTGASGGCNKKDWFQIRSLFLVPMQQQSYYFVAETRAP